MNHLWNRLDCHSRKRVIVIWDRDKAIIIHHHYGTYLIQDHKIISKWFKCILYLIYILPKSTRAIPK